MKVTKSQALSILLIMVIGQLSRQAQELPLVEQMVIFVCVAQTLTERRFRINIQPSHLRIEMCQWLAQVISAHCLTGITILQ